MIVKDLQNIFCSIAYKTLGNGNRAKAPRTNATRTKNPDNKPLGLLKRLLRNMLLTLSCSD